MFISHLLRLVSLRQWCSAVSGGGPSSWLAESHFLTVFLHNGEGGRVGGIGGRKKRMRGMKRVGGITFPSSASRAIIQSDEGHILMTSFNLNYFLNTLYSDTGHMRA